jgi:hypothetical protein
LLIDLVKGEVASAINTELCSIIQNDGSEYLRNYTTLYYDWASTLLSTPPSTPVAGEVEKRLQELLPMGDEVS